MSITADLSAAQKLTLFSATGDEKKFKDSLSAYDAKKLKQIQEFLWGFIVDESQSAKTKRTRSEIMSLLEPTAKYQQRASCTEPLGYCTIAMCVRINPSCATTRITGILTTLRPLLQTLLTERPELLTVTEPEVIPVEELAPVSVKPSPVKTPVQAAEIEGVPLRVRKEEKLPEEIVSSFVKYKPLLWSMIEFESLDHAILMTEAGTVLQSASARTTDASRIALVLADEIQAVIEQGDAATFKHLLTVTKEFAGAVVAIRGLGNSLYLVGISETVLPGKVHSLIVRLGAELQRELAK